jgi:hypothetical protein
MAINQNHTVEELNGVRCAVVEKNVSARRVEFIKSILLQNEFTVEVAVTPPPKATAAKPLTEDEVVESSTPITTETFTIGVTDVTFNWVNAIFGRMLIAPNGHIVTLAYWQQKDVLAQDAIPYFEKIN